MADAAVIALERKLVVKMVESKEMAEVRAHEQASRASVRSSAMARERVVVGARVRGRRGEGKDTPMLGEVGDGRMFAI